jgi:hypothetical protein
MLVRAGVSSVFIAAALACAAAAKAESDGRARAVIQGTGKDVSIVYRTPLRARPAAEASAAADPLAEALRLKKGGADDASVIDYLRQNEAALPDVVDSGTIRQLKRAGAGDPVIATLSTLAAVDIGPTSDDAEAPPTRTFDASDAGAYPDPAGMGYPFYGGFYGGGGYGGGFSGRGRFGNHVAHHGSRGFPNHDGFGFRFHQPAFGSGRSMPSRGARGGAVTRRMR